MNMANKELITKNLALRKDENGKRTQKGLLSSGMPMFSRAIILFIVQVV